MKNALNAPAHVQELLNRLHSASIEQEEQLGLADGGVSINKAAASKKTFDNLMRDKFIALTEDKAIFVHQLIRAKGALTVVEAGTSFGVSTIYLALAVGQNALDAGKSPGQAKVIATEFEESKAARAREHWNEAGDTVKPWIDLREGEILENLRVDVPPIDFVLFDIWTPLVLPTLKLLEPKLKAGAIIVSDNILSSKEGYADFISYCHSADSPYTTVTLPFPGGLGMTTYHPPASKKSVINLEPNRSVIASGGEQGRRPAPHNHIRIARPSHDLARVERFYVEGLGLEVLYRVQPESNSHGPNGHVDELVMLGWPHASWHLELVRDHTEDVDKQRLPRPTDEDLLVIYVGGSIDPSSLDRLTRCGGKKVTARNPYWEEWGVTVEDPDGYRVVLSQRNWANEDIRARWLATK
ncbi:hypothetical protein Q7P37_004431 [Cladosporium fusiforme]